MEGNLKQQFLIKIKCRNIQSIQQARMNHAYCVGSWRLNLHDQLKSRLEKDAISPSLKKTFCLNPKPLTHPRIKSIIRDVLKRDVF